MKGYVEAAESYFRSKVARRSLDELAGDYEELDMLAVLLAWDAETATGRPRVPNELVAQACRDHPEAFVGFGSVDPLKGKVAIDELERIEQLGLKGVKLHPSLQPSRPTTSCTGRCTKNAKRLAWHSCSTPGRAGSAPASQAARASGSTTRAQSGWTR